MATDTGRSASRRAFAPSIPNAVSIRLNAPNTPARGSILVGRRFAHWWNDADVAFLRDCLILLVAPLAALIYLGVTQ